jgi:hypothetical protein
LNLAPLKPAASPPTSGNFCEHWGGLDAANFRMMSSPTGTSIRTRGGSYVEMFDEVGTQTAPTQCHFKTWSNRLILATMLAKRYGPCLCIAALLLTAACSSAAKQVVRVGGAVQHDSTTAVSSTGTDCGPPTTSNYGTGCDGNPTPAQAAALAIELRQYDQSKVQAMVKEAERNGNHPTDQALASAFEYQNACRQAFTAAVAAKSAPANRVASVVNGIINPEITRLRARSVSGDEGYVGFEQVAQQLIAGQATEVIQSFGHTFCGYDTPAYWKALESPPSG